MKMGRNVIPSVLAVLLFIGLGLGAQIRPAAKSPAALTVDQVIELKKAGLSEDVIAAKVKQNGTAYNLSVDQMLKLKQVGISDGLIKLMLDPNAQIAPVANASDGAGPPDTAVAAPSPPGMLVDEVGFYLVEGDSHKQIAASAFSKQKVSGLGQLKMIYTAGISKAKQKAVLRGSNAATRTSNKRPVFLLYAPEGFSPTDYLALRLERKGNSREVVVGAMGILSGAAAGFEDKAIVKFSSEKLALQKYLIRFDANLSPGEYCFYPTGALDASAQGVNTTGRLHDFGVDN